MMAIAIFHQGSLVAVSLLMAFDIQLAIIVIFNFAIMLAICIHDCWHHHNHDITQNLSEKFFIVMLVMTTVMAPSLPSLLWWKSWWQQQQQRCSGRKVSAADKCSIILKALHACHFVFAFGEWVNKSDIYANSNSSSSFFSEILSANSLDII